MSDARNTNTTEAGNMENTKIAKHGGYLATEETWKTGVTPHYNRVCRNHFRVGGRGYRAAARLTQKWSNPNS